MEVPTREDVEKSSTRQEPATPSAALISPADLGLAQSRAAASRHLVAAEVIGVHGALAKIDRKKVMRALKLKRKT